ncbi:MAG: hypothetical protein JWQ29_2185, partial [Phenylobacterium sp.]|nr:hypothetical protein [Phenylobacterium sp.]
MAHPPAGLAAALALLAGAAAAAPATPGAVQDLLDCDQARPDAARLACYDAGA